MITDILTKRATATVAILIGPLAIFKQKNDEIHWEIVFFTSIFALLAALYVLIAVVFRALLAQG